MKETMRVRTINELLRLTRNELCKLAARITVALSIYPEGWAGRTIALINLRNIRLAPTRRDLSP
jgi:hypothetical protein